MSRQAVEHNLRLVPDDFAGSGEVSISASPLVVSPVVERSAQPLNFDARRIADVVLASIGLILIAPIMAILMIAIRLDSAGSPLFLQERVGRDGRRFRMLKLRTMHAAADEQKAALERHNLSSGLFKIPNDPRITRVGRFLRRKHFDEFPQLWNVVRGDMNLIGPRPLVPSEHAAIPDAARLIRERVRPGITGPWQLLGPLDAGLIELAELDVAYILSGPSTRRDLALLARTIGSIAGGRGH